LPLKKRLMRVDPCSRGMRQRARSQATVEFALVAGIVLIPMLFAIFDFGMVLSDWVSATTAASVGARQAAVGACFVGSGSTPATCPIQNETSVIGAVLQSAPLLAADGNCQNPAQPAANFQCLSRVDVALVDMNEQQASCESVELWQSRQSARSGSTSTAIVIGTPSPQVAFPTNSLVGMLLTFTSGPNNNLSQAIIANTTTTMTVASAFPYTPAPNDSFQVTQQTFRSITSGWLSSCSATPPSPQINDTLTIVVHSQVDLPVLLPALPASMQVESSSTVRFEGEFVP
jgi:hypothetical protein